MASETTGLALATHADGKGELQPLAKFMTNPAGSAIVNALGPIRQIVESEVKAEKRYLVIAVCALVVLPLAMNDRNAA